MRRTVTPSAIVLALTLALTLTAVQPARAHFCSSPVEFEVNKPGAIAFGVPAEDFAVNEVDVTIPDRFKLTGLDGPPEWKSTQDGKRLHLLGGPIPPFACAFFTLRGVVSKPGKLLFPFVIRGQEGQRSEYKGTKINDPLGAQLVFAGVSPKDSDFMELAGEEGSGSPLQPFLLAVAGGLIVGGVLALLARRRVAGR